MRFIFKTSYAQDIRLFQHGGQVFWYGLLAVLLLAAPYLVSGYVLSQLHFICIYAIVGLGLMLLVGYTGQISLGHAAFLAVGAYTEALLQGAGVPFVVSLACAALFSAVVGIIVGLPALRLTGIYLAIATFAFNVIVEEIITRWESVTGGNSGKLLKAIELFGFRLSSQENFYYFCRALQDDVICALRRAHRHRRRALCPQGRLHLARAVHADPVDRARHHRDHRRRRLAARRGAGRGVHHHAAAGNIDREGLAARRRVARRTAVRRVRA